MPRFCPGLRLLRPTVRFLRRLSCCHLLRREGGGRGVAGSVAHHARLCAVTAAFAAVWDHALAFPIAEGALIGEARAGVIVPCGGVHIGMMVKLTTRAFWEAHGATRGVVAGLDRPTWDCRTARPSACHGVRYAAWSITSCDICIPIRRCQSSGAMILRSS